MSSPHARAFRILFVCLMCIGIGQSMLFAILPPAAREIGLSPFQVSTIFATSATIWVFVSPWWGRRSDIWGRRQVILIGLLGYALSMALLATMIQIGLWKLLPVTIVYPLMIASRSMFAVFGSGTGPASQAYVADRTTRAERTAGVALVSAAMGFGETIGPGVGAALASFGLLAPIYLSAVLAVISSISIWFFLPEEGPPHRDRSQRPPRMRVGDRRVRSYVAVGAVLQAVRATTVITFAFYLQDTLSLSPERTVQLSGAGFVVLAVAGLIAQLIIVQRFKPAARWMMQTGAVLMLIAFALIATQAGLVAYYPALALLGSGLGLLRPGTAAAASLAVEPDEQGSVAGLIGGVTVIGNVFGPMLGTSLYTLAPSAPYLLNTALMSLVVVYLLTSKRVRVLRS